MLDFSPEPHDIRVVGSGRGRLALGVMDEGRKRVLLIAANILAAPEAGAVRQRGAGSGDGERRRRRDPLG